MTDSDDETVVYIPPQQSLSLSKTALPTTYSYVGQEITYSFEVTNTCNVVLTGVHVTDHLDGLSEITPEVVTLPVGATQVFHDYLFDHAGRPGCRQCCEYGHGTRHGTRRPDGHGH